MSLPTDQHPDEPSDIDIREIAAAKARKVAIKAELNELRGR